MKFLVVICVYAVMITACIFSGRKNRGRIIAITTLALVLTALSGMYNEVLARPGIVRGLFFGSMDAQDGNVSGGLDEGGKKEASAVLTEWNTALLQENYKKTAPLYCEASSYLTTEENDFAFPGSNVIDSDTATSWQDGRENQDAIGETLRFGFDSTCSIRCIVLRNGNAMADENYYNNSRIKILRISDDNGHTAQVKLEDINNWQQIELAGFEDVRELTFEVVSEYEGEKYQDTCVSEVEFYCE